MILNTQLQKIGYEAINDKFSYGNYGEFKVILMNSNGYINATKLCASAKKQFVHWMENKQSKALIESVENEIKNVAEEKAFIKITGTSNTLIRGTYVHPLLITHIASWCSAEFAVKVSIWLEEWKRINPLNSNRYWNALSNIKPSTKISEEKIYQMNLHKTFPKSKIEVETPAGFIDLLTSTEIIEIKRAINWKNAIGQVISYGFYYPRHKKVIYLFEMKKEFDHVKEICRSYNIELRVL